MLVLSFFMASTDDQTVIFGLDGDLLGPEVLNIHADTELFLIVYYLKKRSDVWKYSCKHM